MLYRFVDTAMRGKPLRRCPMKHIDLMRFCLSKPRLKEVGEQVMVSKPTWFLAYRHDKQISTLNSMQPERMAVIADQRDAQICVELA